MKKVVNRRERAQVWIETVIYLLIAFLMIGMVLSFVRPKIEELKDKTIIEQSLGVIENIENTILNIGVEGNKRIIEIGVKKGSFNFDCQNDTIEFEMESYYAYSEPGQKVQVGSIVAETKQRTRNYIVVLTSNYSSNYNLSCSGKEDSKLITKSSVPYNLLISNEGKDLNKKTLINVKLA